MYLSEVYVKILFEEFNKGFDKSYKFICSNGNQIKIYTNWSVLECNLYIKKNKIIVILSNNWCSMDINILINCLTNVFHWEYLPQNPSCLMSNFCYIFCPLCYIKNTNTYNSKLIFEM